MIILPFGYIVIFMFHACNVKFYKYAKYKKESIAY